jgi:hypothetical protein
MEIAGKYQTQHGELIIVQNGNKVTGNYQTNGVFDGQKTNNIVAGIWRNKDNSGNEYEGLFEWIFDSECNFSGKYKTGLDDGPMRGKWDGKKMNDSSSELIEIARHLEKDEFKYFGAEIALKKLTKPEVEELLDLLQNQKLTTSDNRFLSNYYDSYTYFKAGIPINEESEFVSDLVDNDALSNPAEIDFFEFDSDDCTDKPIFRSDEISRLIFEDGFKLVTVRFEDTYMKGKGLFNSPIYPRVQSIPIIGSILFNESNYHFLDGFCQSTDTVHNFNEEEYELETTWGNMKEMEMEIGEGDGNIYQTYQILIYSNGLEIDFNDVYDPDEIKEIIGHENMIVYSNRETDKISFVEVEEDLSPIQIDEEIVDFDLVEEKISNFRSKL